MAIQIPDPALGAWFFPENAPIPMEFVSDNFALRISKGGRKVVVGEVTIIDAIKMCMYTVRMENGLPVAYWQAVQSDPDAKLTLGLAPLGEKREVTPKERRRMNFLLHNAAGCNCVPFPGDVTIFWRTALDMCASPNSQRHTPRRQMTKVSPRKAHKR